MLVGKKGLPTKKNWVGTERSRLAKTVLKEKPQSSWEIMHQVGGGEKGGGKASGRHENRLEKRAWIQTPKC